MKMMDCDPCFRDWRIPCALLCISLASSPALADFVTGFEAGDGYLGTAEAGSKLVPQQDWQPQFGNSFDVHTYAGSQIPWSPSTGAELYVAPLNPMGGEQFVALGTSTTSGAASDVHAATFAGLVEMSADYAPGWEFDNGTGNYNGALLARMGTTNVAGMYTCAASNAVGRMGPWAFSVQAYDAAGTKLTNWSIGYRFDGVEGFDGLPMEQWHRIGIVFDMDSASPTYRRIMQLKSQDLTLGGQIWIMDEPKGPGGEDLYIEGGENGASVPDLVRLYNVGNGTLSMFDNLYVGAPYDWSRPGGSRLQLEITRDPVADTLSIGWDSQAGKLYNLRSTTDPASADSKDWPVFDGQMDLPTTPPRNMLTFPFPADASRYFVVEEFNAPPVSVFFDDLENGQGAWTTGLEGDAGTAWELGVPAVLATGPSSAHSPDNCFATNIGGGYTDDALVWLRSPAIDLTDAVGGTLRFFHFKDIENNFDLGTINVLDAADDSLIAELQTDIDDFTTDWEEVTRTLPAEAMGKNIKIEFRFEADDFNQQPQAGWYIDDVEVTARK